MKLVFEKVETDKAPIPRAPYSQAFIAANILSLAGFVGVNPETNELEEGAKGQTTQIIRNIEAVKVAGHERLKSLEVIKKYSRVESENQVFYVNPDDANIIKTICFNRFTPRSTSFKLVDELPIKALVEIRSKEVFGYPKLENYYSTSIHSSNGVGSKAIAEIEYELKNRGFGLERVFHAEVHTNSLEKNYDTFNNIFSQKFPQRPSRAMFQTNTPHEIEISCESYLGGLDN